MKVKPTVAGAVIRFPNDPRRRLPDEGDDVPDTGEEGLYWNRLLRTKEIALVAPAARAAPAPVAAVEPSAPAEPDEPTGREPLTPITTR